MQAYESIYQKQRKRSDLYLPAMNQLAANILFQDALISVNFIPPTAFQDQRLGTDMFMEVDRIRLAYRTRSHKYMRYFLEGFTLRTPSELEKVKQGIYADYLLYAVEHPTNLGELDAGVLIDMKSVGAQLNTYPEILQKAVKGDGFIDINYDAFPHPVLAGYRGVKPKEKEIERRMH